MPYKKITPTGKELLSQAEQTAPHIAEATREITGAIYWEHPTIVIAVGASSQSAALLVKEAWKKLYPNTPMPKFAAISDRYLSTWDRSNSAIEENLRRVLNNASTETKIFLLREHTTQGYTLQKFRTTLERMGYKRINTGSLIVD
jgi:hypothetical protein